MLDIIIDKPLTYLSLENEEEFLLILNELWKEVRTADKDVFIISISKLN